jgi:hypothetical protein
MSIPSSSASVALTAEQVALDKAALDLAPLLRCVAPPGTARGGSRSSGTRSAAKRWMSSAPCGSSRSRSCGGRGSRGRRRREASPSADARAPSSSSRSSGFQRRTVRSARGAAVALDDGRVDAEQPVGELRRVRDRRRREQELRLGAVHAAEPPSRRRTFADVRAEHAAVDVRLVDDDVAEVRSTSPQRSWCGRTPTWSMSGLVRIEVRPAADLPAALASRVAVVDRRRVRGTFSAAACATGPARAPSSGRGRARALRLARERVEHGQVERERLARRGARRDDDVLAALRRLPRLGLVREERVVRQPLADARVERLRHGNEPRPREGSVETCAISSASSRSAQAVVSCSTATPPGCRSDAAQRALWTNRHATVTPSARHCGPALSVRAPLASAIDRGAARRAAEITPVEPDPVMPAKGAHWFHEHSRSRRPTRAAAPASRPT